MARKKDIDNLISGIIGESENNTPTGQGQEKTEIPNPVVEALSITPEMEEQLNKLRREKVGRPKGSGVRSDKTKEGRATFVVDMELVRKVKYISLADSRLLKDIISEALNTYISKWEDRNGIIKLPKGEKR